MIVPVVVGAYFGPLPAAIATGLGNIFADVVRQSDIYYNWAIGNAVLGLFVGALPLYGVNIRKGIFEVKHIVLLHTTSPDNAQILGDFIDYALSQGYEFRSLDQYSHWK